jgi:hypothetical protein
MEPVDTLVSARWVVPVEPDERVLAGHSVAIRGGRIVAVLPTAEAMTRFDAAEVVDRPDHVLLPGLVNAHTHAAMVLLRGRAENLLLGPWLLGWAFGEVFAIQQILAPGPPQAKIFLAVWLALWTVGGCAAAGHVLWMLVGRERLRLTSDALTLKREVFGLGRTKRYDLQRIRGLRATAIPPLPPGTDERLARSVAGGLHLFGVGGGSMTFRSGP